MGSSRATSGKSKDKSFSSKGKIEKYNSDGTETVLIMGRPFRVVQKICQNKSEEAQSKSKGKSKDKDKALSSYVFLVENVENLPEFSRHLVVKRSFFKVDEVLAAHREPEILNRIRDKGIVRVFHSEVTRNDGRLGTTVAMEYCSSNLQHRLQQEPRMVEGEIVQVLLALTSVVGYLHSRQPPIAHRDIRPANVLIHPGPSGGASASVYRLCNFASATTEAYLCENHEEVMMATEDIAKHTKPGFRAPEMLDPSGHKRIDERVDMWAIGVLLYYMMYLRLPFSEASWGQTRRPQLRFPVEPEVWYSGSLRVVLEHLLEPDPDKRWDVFALTNFLRFDDEINKHIGPFCFSLTEWPDGWEQQDIKVVNRPVPPKAPPLHLDGRICVSDDGLESSGKGQVSASAKSATSKQGDGAGNKGGFDMEAVFGLGTDLSPNDQQTGTHGKTHLQEQGGLLDGVAKPSQSANDAGAEKTAKADILDDLFVSTPAEPPKPSAQEAPKPNTAQSLVSDSNWRGSLFNAPQPTPPQMHADAASGLWGSGMPAAPGAGIPGGTAFGAPFAPPQQPQFPQTWYGAPAPGFGGMASQPQMQPAAPMNMTTFPAANFPPQTASMPMPKKEEKKDPFADLFA